MPSSRRAADGAPEWPLVAHHYEQAERFDEAASAYQKASANARQRGALRNLRSTSPVHWRTQRAACTQSCRVIGVKSPFGSSAVSLRRVAAGHTSTEAAAEFERCLQLINGTGPSLELFGTFSALWSYYTSRGDLSRSHTSSSKR